MEASNNIERIDQYLLGRFSETEKVAFETEVAQNTVLAEALAEQKTFHTGLEVAGEIELLTIFQEVEEDLVSEGFLQTIQTPADYVKGIEVAGEQEMLTKFQQAETELAQEDFFQTAKITTKPTAKIVGLNIRRTLALAASIALLLVAGWWFLPTQNNSANLYTAFYQPQTDVLSEEIELTGFAKKDYYDNLETAMQAYQQGDFLTVINQITTYKAAAPSSDELMPYADFYLGIAYLETNQIEKAQNLLHSLINQTNFPLQNAVKWYLGLSFLKSNQPEQAQDWLLQLEGDSAFGEKAKRILEKLE